MNREAAQPRCIRSVVPVDLRADWPSVLLRFGFRKGERTAWTAEGLLAYLQREEAVRLLEATTRLSANGSEFAFEQASISDDSVLARASALPAMGDVASMWHDETAIDVVQWLNEHDWNATVHDRESLANRFGRKPGTTTAHFVTATLSR